MKTVKIEGTKLVIFNGAETMIRNEPTKAAAIKVAKMLVKELGYKKI